MGGNGNNLDDSGREVIIPGPSPKFQHLTKRKKYYVLCALKHAFPGNTKWYNNKISRARPKNKYEVTDTHPDAAAAGVRPSGM